MARTGHRALIVDDERLARRELAYLLQAHPEIEVVGEAGSLGEAARLVEALQPDLVFLDVQLGGETGFDLYERVRLEADVVFVTAHDEFSLRAFEVNALDYLMKPVDPSRLSRTVARLQGRRSAVGLPRRRLAYGDAVLLQVDGAPRLVKLSTISCIRAERDYSRLVGATGPIGLVLKRLAAWELILPERQFCRIHRSVIVNFERVSRIEPWFGGSYQVHLEKLPEPILMSRRFARRFRNRFAV